MARNSDIDTVLQFLETFPTLRVINSVKYQILRSGKQENARLNYSRHYSNKKCVFPKPYAPHSTTMALLDVRVASVQIVTGFPAHVIIPEPPGWQPMCEMGPLPTQMILTQCSAFNEKVSDFV